MRRLLGLSATRFLLVMAVAVLALVVAGGIAPGPDLCPGTAAGPVDANGCCDCQTIPPPPGLVSWWPGDGNADDIVDGNHGTLQNGATFAPGKVAQAFSFDGEDDFLDYGTSTSFDWGAGSSFTYDFWLKTTDERGAIISQRLNANGAPVVLIALGFAGFNIFGEGELGVLLRDDTGSRAGCYSGCTEVDSDTRVDDNEFHHIAVVRDGAATRTKIYIDGVEKASVVDGIGPGTPDQTKGIGTGLTNGITTDLRAIASERYWFNVNWAPNWNFFKGLIDEVEIFNRALSQAEIQALFDADSAGKLKINGCSPRDICIGVRDELQEIVVNNPDTDLADKIEDALAYVATGCDALTQTPPDNQAAVGAIEGAVGDLQAAVDAGLLDPLQGTDLMDRLAWAARLLAADALAQAIALPGDPDVADAIAVAQAYLADGDALRASGAYKDAVNEYKDALAKAESILP